MAFVYEVQIPIRLSTATLEGDSRRVTSAIEKMVRQALDQIQRIGGGGAPGGSPSRGGGGSGRAADEHIKQIRAMEREAARAAKEVEHINAQTAKQAEQQARIRERAEKAIADARIRESRRAANDFLQTQKEMTRAAAREEASRLDAATRTRRMLGVAAAAVGAAVLLGAREAKQTLEESVRLATELRRQVANIASIKPEINADQVFKALNEMQRRIPQTAEQLAEALYDVFSSVNATQAEGLQLVEKFARGATAALTDAKTFGTSIVGVVNAYGAQLERLGGITERVDHIQDVFFNTVKNGVVSGQELAANLGLVTQAGKNVGVTFDELGALIAGVTKEGGSASQNINNLANTLQKLPTKESQKALRALKIETVDLQTGGFRPILSVLSDLKGRLDELPPALRAVKLQSIFPDAQARTGIQTLLSQLDFIKAALIENQNEAGAAGNAYQTMAQTYAVASALQDNALKSFQTTVGNTIIQNARWVKATEIVTQQINGQTDALQKAGSQSQQFAEDFTNALSKIKVGMIPIAGAMANFVNMVAQGLGAALTAVTGAVLRFLEDVAHGMEGLVVLTLNTVIRLINGVESLLEKAGLKGAIGVGGQIEYFKEPQRPNFGSDFFFKETKKAFDAMLEAGKSLHSLSREWHSAVDELDRAAEQQRKARQQTSTGFGDLRRIEAAGDAASARTREAERLAEEERRRTAGGNTKGVSGAMTEVTGRRRQAEKVIDDAEDWRVSEIREIQDWFKATTGRTLPVRIGQSEFHNRKGWDHRNAADVALHPDSLEGRLLIERLKAENVPYSAWRAATRNARGELIATGPHIHIGEPSHAFGKNVRSRAVTRSRLEDEAFLVWDAQGRPVSHDLIRSGGQLPEGASVTRFGSEQIYGMQQRAQAMIAASRDASLLAGAGVLAGGLVPKLTTYEAARKATDDQNEEQIQALYDRRMNLEKEYTDQVIHARTERENREMDYLVNVKRAEADLHEMRIENSNEESVANRRLALAKSEEVDLTKHIQDVQDRIANGPYNQSLRIQAALLEDILELRGRDEQAIIAQNRAQLELADATVYHAEQANAKVLEYLASQRSITDVIADAKISVIDTTFSAIDSALGRMTEKLGIVGNLVKDLISGFIRLALNRAFQSMMLGGQGGTASGGGFSFGNFLGGLFGGGGSGGGFLTGGFAGGASPAAGISAPPSLTSQAGALNILRQAGMAPAGGGATATGGALAPASFGQMLATAGPLAAVAISLSTWQAALGGNIGPGKALLGGGLLGLGLSFIGRSRLRRQEEEKRDALSNDTGTAIWQLIRQAQLGQLGVAEARQQFDAIKARYFQAIPSLRDAKTRRHAELQWNDFQALWPILEQNAKQSDEARTRSQRLIPSFASGGVVPSLSLIKVQAGERVLPPHVQDGLRRRGGFIPGTNRGIDDTYMMAEPGTVIQPVRAFAAGDVVGASPSSSTLVIDELNLTVDEDGAVKVLIKSKQFTQAVVKTTKATISSVRRFGD